MADIQTYLRQLETRLAPTLDVQSLQERLTEAEVHLRDRAQEFEEIGLPPLEAEARAVAAFGEPEEFAPKELAPEELFQEARPQPSSKAKPERRREIAPRDLGLQLAWSVVGLGLVGMLTSGYSAWIAGSLAAAFIGLGALFGRTTSLVRIGLLAAMATIAAYPILLGFYDPLSYIDNQPEKIGVRLRDQQIGADYIYRGTLFELARFDRAREAFVHDGEYRGATPEESTQRLQGSNGQIFSRKVWLGPSSKFVEWDAGIAWLRPGIPACTSPTTRKRRRLRLGIKTATQ